MTPGLGPFDCRSEPFDSVILTKVSFTLLNWIHDPRLSKNPPFPPF